MPVPRVAIVGRPNVGKSSLFNWIAQRQIAVVDSEAGVTRDRVTTLVEQQGRWFELIDTGGIGIEDADRLDEEIDRQIRIAIETADLILLVVDGAAGLNPLDRVVAERLRPIEKPKLLVVNKCDSPKLDDEMYEFFQLTQAPAVITSVVGRRNRDELLAAVVGHLPPAADGEASEGAALAAEPEMKAAIVGRRNVGKSTFINQLAETERVIVSEVPGTTRDSVDIRFAMDGKTLVAIDTPGVRRRKSVKRDLEFYGLVRAKKSIRRADVVFMFFDSQKTISRVDKQLVGEIADNYKPCVFVINKWDLAGDMTMEAWSDYLLHSFPSMDYVPVALITAETGKNIRPLVNLAQSIFKQARTRVNTGQLNQVVQAAIEHKQPPVRKGKRPKIYFATQVATQPPTIVLKCNEPTLFDRSWQRYLLNVFHEELPFEEVPIKVYYRPRQRDDEGLPSLEESRNVDHLPEESPR